MWSSFWFNNVHFAVELFGAVVLLSLAWLTFDGFLLDREPKTLVLSIGLFLFAVWGVINSLGVKADAWLALASFCYIAGLVLIVFNAWRWSLLKRPEFSGVLIFPAITSIMWQIHIVSVILFLAAAYFYIMAYRESHQKQLRPFIGAMFILAASGLVGIFSSRMSGLTVPWIIEHSLKFIAAGFLTYWGWQYLKVRVKEEMLLIFVSMALFISVIVTFTFSAVLLNNMENEAKFNLVANTKVVEYTLERMKGESLSVAELLAKDAELRDELAKNDFKAMEKTGQDMMIGRKMDFLTIANKDGEVVLRAHSLIARGDSVKTEDAAGSALSGRAYATIEPTNAEKLSIRGAAPVYGAKGEILGAIITGYIIDNSFVDKLKKEAGLEAAVYEDDELLATTILGPDGKTRNVGSKQTDKKVLKDVLEDGKSLAISTMIFSRPYLVSYLPLKNTEGRIVGLIQSARLQTGLAETANSASRLTLLITVAITIMTLMPFYFVAKRLSEEA